MLKKKCQPCLMHSKFLLKISIHYTYKCLYNWQNALALKNKIKHILFILWLARKLLTRQKPQCMSKSVTSEKSTLTRTKSCGWKLVAPSLTVRLYSFCSKTGALSLTSSTSKNKFAVDTRPPPSRDSNVNEYDFCVS